jgi:HSP20 family protein
MLDLMRMFEELSAMPATPKVNVDILNESDHYEIHADLPGYAKEDISIEFKDGMLTITAEKKTSSEESKKDYIRRERYHGSVTRSISVGDINPATLKASMQNGTLIITFPKMEEAPKTRKITID